MKISLIKSKANDLFVNSKQKLIRTILLVLLMQNIPSIYTGDNVLLNMLTMILSIVFMFLSHAIVVETLKIVRNQSHELQDDDYMIGIRRWSELLPTYFTSYIFQFIIILAVMIIMGVFVGVLFGDNLVALLTAIQYLSSDSLYFDQFPALILGILFISVILLVTGFVVSALVFPMPYLYEKYKMRPMDNLKESINIMKHHFIDYLKLELSYFGWLFLVYFITTVLTTLLSAVPLGSFLAVLASVLLQSYTYYPKYMISKAILFEEITYHRYEKEVESSEVQSQTF